MWAGKIIMSPTPQYVLQCDVSIPCWLVLQSDISPQAKLLFGRLLQVCSFYHDEKRWWSLQDVQQSLAFTQTELKEAMYELRDKEFFGLILPY